MAVEAILTSEGKYIKVGFKLKPKESYSGIQVWSSPESIWDQAWATVDPNKIYGLCEFDDWFLVKYTDQTNVERYKFSNKAVATRIS